MPHDVLLKFTSKITAKGQTTVPKSIRQALGVEVGDDIEFRREDFGVVVRRAARAVDHTDPVIGGFLQFLAKDMHSHPERLQVLSSDLIDRVRNLVGDVDVDVDAAIEGDVAI